MDRKLVERATEMFGVRRTWVLGGRRYLIEAARPGQRWYVDLSLNPPFCTCPQYSYRCRGTEACKHIVFFWAFGAWYENPDRFIQRWGSGRDQPESDSRGVGLVRD